jgi:type II secretory pathway predicted ATPase ExeA
MNLRQILQRSDRPFLSHPQVGRYFPAASIEDSRRRLARSIERGDGPGVVIGGEGNGKSLLLQVLAAQYHERFDVVLLACAHMHTRRGLLQAIHFELGLDHQQRDEGELRLSLLDHLLAADQSSQGLLLLVDEAQSMPIQLLEEIRVFGNLARNGAPRVRVVLAGLPPLEERLASPELNSLSQRLTARCYLAPFARAETTQYVQAQVAVCGADPSQIFAADTWDDLFEATDGVPRLVNQLCDRAMLLADDRRQQIVDAAIIQAAWADLQQLPAPAESLNGNGPDASDRLDIVEFGNLGNSDLHNSLEIAVGIPTTRELPLDPSDDLDAPIVAPRDNSTVATYSAEPIAPAMQRRPRTFDDCVPEAVDPFADEFEDEEIVLDRFAPLAELFHVGTPRVANRRDPAFAGFVGQAIADRLDAPDHLDASDDLQVESKETRIAATPQHVRGDTAPRRGFGPGQPTIRLAVVDESAPSERGPGRAHAPLANIASKVTSDFALDPSFTAVARTSDDPILVIEDEPIHIVRPQPSVRREAYRDLFSRLRHGT